MKFSVYLLSLLFGSMLIFACSEHVPNEQEQLYLNTTDSLQRYKNVPYLEGILEKSDEMRDHLTLDYEDFKEKYDLTDGEMEIADALYTFHIDFASRMVPRYPKKEE